MPTVRKITGGRVRFRSLGREFSRGTTADVSGVMASYLVDVRGGFERLDSGDGGSGDESAADDLTDIDGIGDATADKLAAEAHIHTRTELANADAEVVANTISGVSVADVTSWQRQLGA